MEQFTELKRGINAKINKDFKFFDESLGNDFRSKLMFSFQNMNSCILNKTWPFSTLHQFPFFLQLANRVAEIKITLQIS